MSFRLRITFRGLCLFVCDRRSAVPRVTVLLPNTEMPMPSGGVMPHRAVLLCDVGYTLNPARMPSPPTLQRAPFTSCLEAMDFSTAGLTSSPLVPTLPCETLDISTSASEVAPIDEALLDPATFPRDMLTARLILTAGAVTERALGPNFTYAADPKPDVPAPRAWTIEWTICDVEASSVKLGTMRLFPINGLLDVFIYHVPTMENPVLSPLTGSPIGPHAFDHIAAYYALLNNPVGTLPVPRYSPYAPDPCAGGVHVLGIVPYTCLPGQLQLPIT
ncbi:MAG TPA: hypothetical protein VFW98_18760 [Gemmatimonadaceae bacterium]|nr:hypothetical protein [Gemmatimonadaceae bacterium]